MVRYIQDYLKGTSQEDATLAAVQAMNDCRDGDVLCLGGKELHFYPSHGEEREYYISNNDYGIKKIAFLLHERKNITIDGKDARLVFHGMVSPFVIDICENVAIRNLTVDYAEPMYFEGEIRDSGENFVEVEYDASRFHVEVQEGAFRFWGENWENVRERVLVNEFDPVYKGPVPQSDTYFAHLGKAKEGGMHAGMFRYLTASKPAANRLRLEGPIHFVHSIGKRWLCTHCNREVPGIFAKDSKGILLENIVINHSLAMGVICQLCENISLNKVIVAATPDRSLSINADATHFVNCSGRIHMKECSFESMMDDACNIHGIYMPVERKVDNRKVLLSFGHHQQQGVNIFRPGDPIRLVHNEDLLPCSSYTVKEAVLISKDRLLLETEEELPEEIPEGFVFENHSRMPEVHIEYCNSGYNRPRGFLLTTGKKVLVENCTFHNMSHAISVAGDANSWFESGGCGEIILRNNQFDNAAYSGGAVILVDPQIKKDGKEAYHRRLVVEDNHFRTNGKRFLYAKSVEQVIFRNNTFMQDDTLAYHPSMADEGFEFVDCRETEIEQTDLVR